MTIQHIVDGKCIVSGAAPDDELLVEYQYKLIHGDPAVSVEGTLYARDMKQALEFLNKDYPNAAQRYVTQVIAKSYQGGFGL